MTKKQSNKTTTETVTETVTTETVQQLEKVAKSINKLKNKEISVSVKRDNGVIKEIVKLHGEFSQMFATTVFDWIIDYKLSRNDILVLLGYCSLMEYGNIISISQRDVASKIGIAQPNIARSVKRLKEVGIFYSTVEAPRSLYIHPAFIAKGDLSQYKDMIKQWEKNYKNKDKKITEQKKLESENKNPVQTDLF